MRSNRLTAEVLGKGSGVRSESYWGGTMGRDNLYIDLLLYDAPAFYGAGKQSAWGNIPILSIWPNFGRRVIW